MSNAKDSMYLLTGATGWLGRRLANAITKGDPDMADVGVGGRRLRCLVTAGESAAELLALGAEVVQGDIRDPEACAELCRDAEAGVLIHTAGVIHPPGRSRLFEEVNVGGTANLLNAARNFNIGRLVAISSNSPFGANPSRDHRFVENSPYNPYLGYGKSKWRMEQLLKSVMGLGRPQIVIIRAPWFYGPGQPARQNQFYSMIRKGAFPLMGDGGNMRSKAYVDSLAYGALLAANRPQAVGQCYWIADDRPYSMREIVETVRAVLAEDFGIEVSSRTLRVPSVIADAARIIDTALQAVGLYHQKAHVLGEMNLTIACDIGKAVRDLGYRPLVDLREGQRRSIAWSLDNGLEL